MDGTWCGALLGACVALSGCAERELAESSAPLTEGTLPGGTPVEIDVVSPLDDQVFATGASVPITGFVRLTPLAPVADTTLVIVIDVSGSTTSGGNPTCGDANGDGLVGRVLDCEVAAAQALVEAADASGRIADIAIVVFANDAAIADVGPAAGIQVLTAPDAGTGPGDTVRDLDEVLRSARSGGSGGVTRFTARSVGNGTSYHAGVTQALAAAGASSQPNQQIVFMSDGLNLLGPPVVIPAGAPPIQTFGVGAAAICDQQSPDNPNGDLELIAAASGLHCVHVEDPGDLPDVLPGLVQASLLGVSVAVHSPGEPTPTVLPTMITSPPGADPTTFAAEATGLAPGDHLACATATAQDVGAPTTLTDCAPFHINVAPDAVCVAATVEAGALCAGVASIDGGSDDPDSPFTCVQTPAPPYPLGATEATLTCSDELGGADACTAIVTVVDTIPPVLRGAPAPGSLWPPEHAYHAFALGDCGLQVEDSCSSVDLDAAGTITHITSDEPENGAGDGNTCDDAVITGASTANLRAERAGNGDGRVYRVHFEVTDEAGNTTPGSCVVQVVKSQSAANDPAIDSGCAYCVGAGCDAACPLGSPGC
ncbi:MAG: hypothetical protein K8M05_20805 [Deltaproteobacteria bacterium]|nr:hypothetical protein [Kofleriaceae bacterium]